MELGETETICSLDNDGVGAGDVDAGLDDRRAQQDIEALLVEVAHDELQLAFGHLSMRDANAGFWEQLGQRRFAVVDGLDLVVDEIDLAAALELAQHRLADLSL